MKNRIICFFISFLSINLSGQEFSFTLYVEDAIGNRDSVIVGYDEDATDGEDPAFGELDIEDIPFNGALDVRVVNYDYQLSPDVLYPENLIFFQSKIQIVKKDCSFYQGPFPPPGVGIKADNYPITITWDSTAFEELCTTQSVFTDWHPGGWFDASDGSLTKENLKNTSQVIIEKHFAHSSYLTDNLDTVKLFFIGFIPDPTIVDVKNINKEEINFSISPNPTSHSFFIKNKTSTNTENQIQLFDLNGKMMIEKNIHLLQNQNIEIETTHLSAGIYFLKISNEEYSKIQKIVIQD